MQYYLGKWIFNFVFLIGVAVLNLPNVLTISRIVVIPVIFLSIYIHSVLWSILAGALFVTASITDYLDGYFPAIRIRCSDGCLIRLPTNCWWCRRW